MESSFDELIDFPLSQSQRQQTSRGQNQQQQMPSPHPQPQPQFQKGYFYQIPQGCSMFYQPQASNQQPMFIPQPQFSPQVVPAQQPIVPYQIPTQQEYEIPKEKPQKQKPKFLTRGQRRFILSGFSKDQLAAMRLGNKSLFGFTKEQLLRSAVEITSSRDDVLNLILSACDSTEED